MTEKRDNFDDDELITKAINAHGIFFKKAVRQEIEKLSGVTVIGEEYPIRYLEGGAIDLLVEVKTKKDRVIIPIECKRGYVANKRWIFFEDYVGSSPKFLYHFSGSELLILSSVNIPRDICPVCIEGIEVDVGKLEKAKKEKREQDIYKSSRIDPIWNAGFQACKASHGFLLQELEQRRKGHQSPPGDCKIFPLIITTAPLFVCEQSKLSVDIATGNHQGNITLKDIEWLILRYPFTPQGTLGEQHLNVIQNTYITPTLRENSLKEGIMVLNSNSISGFFKMLTNLRTQEGKDERETS